MRSHRGSRFRGVSRNGEKYQIMVVKGALKKYIGAIDNEDVAGLLYDKYAIMIQGLQVSILLSKNANRISDACFGFDFHHMVYIALYEA